MVADMTLRFGSLRVPTTVRWPTIETVSLALVLADELSPTDPWMENCVVVGLAGAHPSSIELAALQWLSEHVAEFGAEDDHMLVAGGARAARLALAARNSGWPVLQRQLLVHPRFTAWHPMPRNVAGAPPATVVCAAGVDGGRRYAARLRAAGVEVHEVRDDGRR
jgi:acetyl esterase/lipase